MSKVIRKYYKFLNISMRTKISIEASSLEDASRLLGDMVRFQYLSSFRFLSMEEIM